MKRIRKRKHINLNIVKNKEEEESESLQSNEKNTQEIREDNYNEIIIKYKKIIKILSSIIGVLIIILIILFFTRPSKEKKEIVLTSNRDNITIRNNDNEIKETNQIEENKENNENKKNEENIENKKNEDNNNIENNKNINNDNINVNNKNISVTDIISQYNNQTNQTKRKIYVKYMDFWPAFELDRFDVHKILLEKYEVIISDTPDYVIFGEFGSENYGIENKFDCVKLFLTIENRGPNFDITDYAIGIHYLENGDRYFRKPTETHQLTAIGTVYNVTQVKQIDIKKKKFCAWVVSNGSGEARNLFFDKLSQYKTVDSGGSFRNNVGGPVEDKLKFLADYKFSICFENSKTQGYISEKLSDAFEAGTIPIYYGDDTVLELLNNKSYIHVKDESEFDEKIELIKKIDQNDTLYEEMIKEKIVIDDSRYPKEVQKYKDFIYHIIDQDKQKAKRFERHKEENKSI